MRSRYDTSLAWAVFVSCDVHAGGECGVPLERHMAMPQAGHAGAHPRPALVEAADMNFSYQTVSS
jgi:hypothetical protein